MINIKCSQCGQSYAVAEKLAGRVATCRRCGSRLTVPEALKDPATVVPPAMLTMGPDIPMSQVDSPSLPVRPPEAVCPFRAYEVMSSWVAGAGYLLVGLLGIVGTFVAYGHVHPLAALPTLFGTVVGIMVIHLFLTKAVALAALDTAQQRRKCL